MSTTSSKNFTTLYSGSGSVTPQGAYGNANVVSLLAAGTDGANTVTTISATGNIVTDAYFVGNFAGNITGNIAVTGSNTQVLFNNAGNVGAAAGLTFNSSSNVLATTGSVTAVGWHYPLMCIIYARYTDAEASTDFRAELQDG